MSKVDTAWLRMDSAANLMMIVGVWILKPGVSHKAVCERIEARLLRYPRFGQRVEQDAAGATWVTDQDFDIKRHVVIEKLAHKSKGHEQKALQDRLAALAMQPLDMDYPLWQFHLVEHYQGGSALMVRIHHCIADGLALVAVTQSLVDGGPLPPLHIPKHPHHSGLEGAEDWIADTLIKPLTDVAVKALDAAGHGAANAMEMMAEPQKGVEKGLAGSVDLAKLAYQVIRDGSALALMPDDSHTRLKGVPGSSKRVAWCEPIPLEEVKAVSKALNCSINDVLLSCVAGAIGEYLRSLGDDVTGYIQPGVRKLDGHDTLWFARARDDSDDYSRMARQKCVMNALLRQVSPQTAVANFAQIAQASSAMVSMACESFSSGETV